ncbi:cell division ATP-binding protein FtsE [Geothrix fermentans]|uniref:cell division ATP-binding protein FtsE n=1 Tax=Geothrix fermentans TaxID=44676 RepID=UPI000408F522|nr:cell division ATP-binding protein FtsE [Geothrix fermentans]
MITLTHVGKQYDRIHTALADVSFAIESGEFVFLTGPSGAGKSTLLKLLFREQVPSSGEIQMAGHRLAAMSEKEIPLLRRKLGVVFQDFKLIRTRTIFENVAFVLKVLGVSAAEQKQRTFRALKMVGLQHKLSSYPLQLSGGEQQRVAIARALVNDPLVLLADEPTGNLDPDLAQEIMALFERINGQGTTVMVATHDRSLIQRMRKRVIGLDHGRVAFDQPAPTSLVTV